MEWGQYLLELGPGTRGGLKLRMPSQFKETASETKRSACCFWRHFLEAQVKNEDCCSSTCQSVPHSQPSDSPSGLNSVSLQSWDMHVVQRAIAHHSFPHPQLPLFLKAQNIRTGVLVPLSQSQTCAVFHLRTSQSAVCQWHKHVLAGEHMESEQGEEEWRICGEITKHFFKAPLLLCNNLLLPFSFSCKSTPGKDSRLPN